jgi:hypothetical protein
MTKPSATTEKVVWEPQPGPQTELLSCPVKDVLYGGATGGGKTDALIGDFAAHDADYPSLARGILFRRTYPELDEIIQRSREIYGQMGWRYKEKERTWYSPSGGILRLRFFDKDDDWRKYWGHSYSWQGFDELGNWPNTAPLDKLYARLRSAAGVPTHRRSTANPGGVGHGWVKRRYIDPAPPRTPFMALLGRDPRTGEEHYIERCFIPSSVYDNRILLQNNPDYIDSLYAVGSEALVKAWLEGDWDAPVGQFFTEWDENVHVIMERELPKHWLRFRAFDWGSKTPFCVLWIAVSDGTIAEYPRGALIVYREWYGARGHDNVGIELTGEEVGRGIAAREAGETIAYGVADTQIFRKDGGPSIAEQMQSARVFWNAADKERITGWMHVRWRLKGHGYGTPQWRPMLYIMGCCSNLIRTMPQMQHDDQRPEDVVKGTMIEDHAPETLRYGCMSRPWVVAKLKVVEARTPTLNDILASQRPKQQERLRGY